VEVEEEVKIELLKLEKVVAVVKDVNVGVERGKEVVPEVVDVKT